MALKEIEDSGVLQEVNRQFLHPLGLALCVTYLGGNPAKLEMLDMRQDPEGWIFDEVSIEKAKKVELELMKRAGPRMKAIGAIVQPLPGETVSGSGKIHSSSA